MSRFIPNFSQIAAPLRALTKHKVQFKWEEEEQVAFRRLKESLKEETSLAYFVPNQPIRVHVDAGKKMESTSNVPGGLCAILTQQDEKGVWRMCNVANRTLTDIETRYGQTELEALAIKWACSDAFYQFLVGASKFEILTDCKPLVHLFNNPKSRAPIRIERQILAIQGLEYTVVYNKGTDNIADYGSRHITKNELMDQVSNESFEEEIVGLLFEPDSESDRIIMERANEDEHYQVLKDVVENDLWKSHKNNPKISQFYGVASDLSVVKGLVFYKDLLVPPFVMYNAFIDEAHKIGHSGEKRTVDRLRERIWFPAMTKLAKDVVKSCLSCQMTCDRTYDEPLQPTPLPPDVWHTISIDFKGPLKDGKYVLVAYDLYSRYPVVGYCNSTSFTSVKPILDSIFATFGKVHTVKTDNGPPFHGHQFREYAEKKGFYHDRITPRHPRANGECERFLQNLNKAIRIAKRENIDYKEKIEGMLEAYRATPHPSTSRSPYELMFGRKMNLNIFPTMKRRAKDEGIRNHDRKYKEKAKKYHDSKKNVKKSRIRLGDRVLMKDRRIDRLRPEIGLVIGTTEHSVTVKFENGKIFTRDKSHIKVINEVTVPSSQRRPKEKNPDADREQKRYETYDTDESEEEELEDETTFRTKSGREIRKPERYGQWTI